MGHGPSVLLLPSLGRPASDLADLAADLAAAGYTTLLADPPGVEGVAVPDPPPASLHDLVALALAGLENRDLPVAVVGHAFGGRIARCLAADHPELVRSVVVLGGGGRIPGDPEAVAALRACFDARLGPEEHLDAVRTAFFAPTNDPSVWTEGWWPEAAELQRRATSATAVEDWWGAGDSPVLVVVGAEDRISPPANGRHLVDQLHGRAVLVEIAGAGHALLPERPAAVSAAVGEFLARTSPAGRRSG